MPRFAVLDGPTPIAFAHRGAHEQVPENSLRAFEEAHRLGYRFFETDVHVSADGRLYAFHDDVLDRVTDPQGSRQLYERAQAADKTLTIYDGLYHELLNEPEQATVLQEMTAWMDQRIY